MFSASLISADWDFAVWAILMILASLAFWLDTTKVGRNISGVAIILMVSMALSNLSVIPRSAPAYDVIWSYLVPLAIPLLLLKADIRRVVSETKGMFVAFILGTIGTLAGAFLGFWLLPLGDDASSLVGVFSATYIGGSMNMVAVANALELDGSLMTASVAADNIVGVVYMILLAVMPAFLFLRRWLPSPTIDLVEKNLGEGLIDYAPEPTNFNLLHIGMALSLALIICSLGSGLAGALGVDNFSILFITAITVVVANMFSSKLSKLEGDYELGLLFMYIFFAVIGAGADFGEMIDSSLFIVLFAVIIVACHMLVIFTGSRLFRLDLAEVIIASTACALGPANAAALAAGKRWDELVVPSVMLGVFGYVIANFLGVSLAYLLS